MAAAGAAAAVPDLAANVREVQMTGNDANINAGAAPPEVELPQGGGIGDSGPQTWARQPQMQPMYQQVPPGFATPPDPMMTFMHMLNIQMQQFMQGMQQQMPFIFYTKLNKKAFPRAGGIL